MWRGLALTLPAYALLHAAAAAHGRPDVWSVGAGALAGGAAAAIWLEAGEIWVGLGIAASLGAMWVASKAGVGSRDLALSTLASFFAFATAGWLAGYRNTQTLGRALGAALGLELQSTTYVPGSRSDGFRDVWLRGTRAGRRVGGKACFDDDDSKGASRVRLWTCVPNGAPFRAFACHDSWGSRPVDPTLSLVEPPPWPEVRLYATDAQAASRWARSLPLTQDELHALQAQSRLHVRRDSVEWENGARMSTPRLQAQLDFLTRAAARLEGAA